MLRLRLAEGLPLARLAEAEPGGRGPGRRRRAAGRYEYAPAGRC